MIQYQASRLGHSLTSRLPLFVLLAAALFMAPPREAAAQLSPEALIGDSVSEPDSARYSDVNEAIKRFNNRDILGAKQFLENAKRKDPKLPPVGVMLAKMYGLTNNGAAVRPALEQSIDEDPNDPEPYLLLAESTLQANQTIEADALYEKAVNLVNAYDANAKRKREMSIRAYSGRALVAERRKEWKEAAEDLRQWLKLDPEDATAHTRLGQALCMLDQVEEGRQEFETAKKLDDKRASPYVMVASMYERLGQQEQALEQFAKAYSEDRTNETTLVTYAQSLMRAGKLEDANKVLSTARRAVPSSFNVWLLSGVCYRMMNDATKAEQSLMRALSLQPGSRDVFDQLAQVLAESDDADKKSRALQFAATNAKLYPNNADVNVTLSWALYQNGRSREATGVLRKALQSGGGALGADSRVLVAKIFIANKQPENAERLLSSSLTESQGIFVQRAEAEKLLAEMK